MSNSERAQNIGLLNSVCLRRVQELERNGIIKDYRAVLDREASGAGSTVFVTVVLSGHQKKSQRAFEKTVTAVPGMGSVTYGG